MLDETNNQQGDNTSTGEGGSTSEGAETFTKQTVEAMVSKARSDVLSELGRYRKAAEDAVKQVQTIEGRLSRLQEERFEAELEAARDDPSRLREIRTKQREVKEQMTTETDRRKWEAEKATYEERIRRAEVIERRDLAREIATEFKVDYKSLEKFGTDRESMIELAKALPKSGNAQSEQGNQGNRLQEPPESGKTRGIGGKKLPDLIKTDTSRMSFKELVEHKQNLQAATKADTG